MCGRRHKKVYCSFHNIRAAWEGERIYTGHVPADAGPIMGFYSEAPRGRERVHVNDGQNLLLRRAPEEREINQGLELSEGGITVTFIEGNETHTDDFIRFPDGSIMPLGQLGRRAEFDLVPKNAAVDESTARPVSERVGALVGMILATIGLII